jgi:hypothetical protein
MPAGPPPTMQQRALRVVPAVALRFIAASSGYGANIQRERRSALASPLPPGHYVRHD